MQNGFHGSDIEAVAKRFGMKEDEIISFSSNVNPLGLSDRFRNEASKYINCITEYPERDYATLRTALSEYTGIPSSCIIPGNGSTELISAFIRCFEGGNALIVSPAYSEYERSVFSSGGRVSFFELLEEDDFELNTDRLLASIDEKTDIIVICNPVNPTSTAILRTDMERILQKAGECGAAVLVDETYVEFCDMEKYSAEGLLSSYRELFIIRSMSKFFSAPGLRLGYAMTENEEIRKKMEALRDPWSISSFSEKAAVLLLSDKDHIKASGEYIKKERSRVCSLLDELKGYGVKYYSPHANFVLCRIGDEKKNATALFEFCMRRGLMIRDCTGYGSLDGRFFRFCFMDEKSDDLLIGAIREYLAG